MAADVELLPLPGWCQGCGESLPRDMQNYARANVSHATEKLQAEIAGWKLAEKAEHDLRMEAEAEIEALRAEVARAERSVEHTHQWYAVRLEKIKEVAKRVGLWSEVAAIIANGSSSIYDPPTYAQQLNLAKHAAKQQARAERLAEALRDAKELIEELAGDPNYERWDALLRDQEEGK